MKTFDKIREMSVTKSTFRRAISDADHGPFGIQPKVGLRVMKKGKEVKPTPPKIGIVSYTGGKKDKLPSHLSGKNEARVINPKKMDAYRKFAKTNKVDHDSVRMAHDNPNHPESKRMMKNKNFSSALKMYKSASEDTSDAVKAFLAKGGKIKKLPPAKAQGYHGKDDPGKGVHGVMDRPDTKAMGTRKKVKSMGENKEMQTFWDLRAKAKDAEAYEVKESMLGHSDADRLGKSRDDKFKSAASHIDYHHRQSGGHNKSGGDQDRHRYQVAKKLGYNV